MRFALDALQHGHDVTQQEQVFSRQQAEQPNGEETLVTNGKGTESEIMQTKATAFIAPLNRVRLLFVGLDLHRLQPLIVQIHTQQAAGDVSQEVLVVKTEGFCFCVTESLGWLSSS